MIASKKLTAIAVAAASMLGMGFASTSAFAAADTNAANDITITAQDRADNTVNINGRTFTAYKLASYSNVRFNADNTRVEGYDLQSTIDDAALRAAIKSVVTDDKGAVKDAYKDVAAVDAKGNLSFINADANSSAIQFVAKHFYGDADDVYGNNHANNADMRKLADALKGAGLTEFGHVNGANNKASFDLGDDDLGLYLVVETTSPEATGAHSGETISRAMVIGSPFKAADGVYVKTVKGNHLNASATDVTVGEIKLKSDKVTITKDVQGEDELIGVGSVLTFEINTNVPNYKADYQNWTDPITFTVNDDPSSNLDVTTGATNVINNIKVQSNTGKDGAWADVDPAAYTVALNDATKDDANDFTVALKTPADFSGKKIKVTYDAKVTDVMQGSTNNQAWVDFSNDPYTTDHVNTDKVTEKAFQADLDLSKIDFEDNAVKLDGAQFMVYKDGAKDPVLWQDSANHSTYVEATDDSGINDRVNTVTLNTKTLGTATQLKGLASDTDAAGATYKFVETKAADGGYILGDNPVTFTVKVAPKFDAAGELTGVDYTLDAGRFAKFLDSAGSLSNKGTAGALRTADGTVYAASQSVENTRDLDDMPKTGADILSFLAVSFAAMVLGGGLLVAAKKRMNAAE